MSTQFAEGHIPQWTIGDRMAKSLHFAGIKVADMADYLGVSRASVSNWTSGRIMPATQTLRLWALRTGVPYEWLVSGETPKTQDPGSPKKGSSVPRANLQPSDYKDAGSNGSGNVISLRPQKRELIELEQAA